MHDLTCRRASAFVSEDLTMGTVTRLPLQNLSDDELSVQLWELVMAGQRSSHEFQCIEAEMRSRKLLKTELRLATSYAPVRRYSAEPLLFAGYSTRFG
jgi:hypothetical protein